MYLDNDNDYENSKFTNYYIVDIKCKMIVTDNIDPINSQISLEKRVKNYLARNELQLESMEICSEDIFNRTHYIKKNKNYIDTYFQKVQTDSGYYYRTFYHEFSNDDKALLSKVDHITIDGIDYIETDFARYRLIEILPEHFKNLNDAMKSNIAINGPATKMDSDNLVFEYTVPKISSENS